MKFFPLEVMTMEEAIEAQFRLVDCIHNVFSEDSFFQTGDLGLAPPRQFPKATEKVEQVLATYFEAESVLLVRGAGTGAMRSVLSSQLEPLAKVLVHQAPIYPTTEDTIKMMGLQPVQLDYNCLGNNQLEAERKQYKAQLDAVAVAIVQHSRQKPKDCYDMRQVLKWLKSESSNLTVIADDNYVVFKAPKIGYQLGADISVFSTFKLFGPPGIGCVVGRKNILDDIRHRMYSGGSKVQGDEAMETLRSMVYAPVSFAIQSQEADAIVAELNGGHPAIREASIVNAQSRVILVEFKEPIAKRVLEEARYLGAASYPIGSESRYEIPALFYRVSGTFKSVYPQMEETTIRINPMRAGRKTVLRILEEAINRAVN